MKREKRGGEIVNGGVCTEFKWQCKLMMGILEGPGGGGDVKSI